MLRTPRYPVLVVALALFCVTPLLAADGGVTAGAAPPIPFILVGFVGGFVRHDNPNQGPVQFAQSARRILPKNSYVQVFENRHRKAAYKIIVRLLDRDHDGTLSGDEKAQAHIILFGHSWGASAVVLLARELEHTGIPVLLTVQVDSVRKPWQQDGTIPANVAAAVNFYQPHGIIHGRSIIRAAEESKTQILGNYRFDYKQTPVKCDGTSWFDRAFMGQHMQSECDPHIWEQVNGLVRERAQPEPALAAVAGQ